MKFRIELERGVKERTKIIVEAADEDDAEAKAMRMAMNYDASNDWVWEYHEDIEEAPDIIGVKPA